MTNGRNGERLGISGPLVRLDPPHSVAYTCGMTLTMNEPAEPARVSVEEAIRAIRAGELDYLAAFDSGFYRWECGVDECTETLRGHEDEAQCRSSYRGHLRVHHMSTARELLAERDLAAGELLDDILDDDPLYPYGRPGGFA